MRWSSTRKRRRPAAVAAAWIAAPLAVLALVAAGCGGGGGSNGNATNGSGGGGGGGGSTTSKAPIKIGVSLPLTGQFSEPGKSAKQGYQLWASMVNANGGLLGRQVKLDVKDDASKQNTVVSNYNALISQDHVDLLVGTFSSLLNLPASTVAERNKMLYVEPAGGDPQIFQRGYKYLFFTQQGTADHQGDVFAKYILSLPKSKRPKTAAYPTLNDPFAQPVINALRKKFEAAGIKTVYKTVYPPDTNNFDSIASAIKSADPDMVLEGAQFADGVGFMRSMTKVGFRPDWYLVTNAPSFAGQFVKGVGKANTQGVFFPVSWSPDAKTPGNKEFLAAYHKKFGDQEPAEDVADAYTSARVLQAAVEGVGSIDDQSKLADWLRSHSVSTILGTLKWDDTGAPHGEFLIGQWQNGKAQIVMPKQFATSNKILTPNGAG